VTTTNLGSNPRLLKELDLAYTNGFQCTVIQFSLGNWSDMKTNLLKKKYINTHFIELEATRRYFFNWLLSSLIEKIFSLIHHKILPNNWLAFSLNKRSFLINEKLRKLKKNIDWVIAHNPGSFYPAKQFAKMNGSKLGIDIEDYHPGEFIKRKDILRMEKLLKSVLPFADYCSYASPLIELAVKNKINSNLQNSFTILNGFKKSEFQLQNVKNQELKVIWYSQNIDFGRGLELFIDAIQIFKGQINITLIGDLKMQYWKEYLHNKNYVQIVSPMDQVDLNLALSNYDIGLASDIPLNYNREIAVTNKIISYAQSGIWILATNTPAHVDFLNTFSLHSTIVNYDLELIKSELYKLLNLKDEINSIRGEQYKIGGDLSWEKISEPLVQIWKSK
jgi:hypothetical protein